MPRPVPSEIVRTIDKLFPWAQPLDPPTDRLSIEEIGRISAIVSLIDRLPEERLVLPPDAYTDFITHLENLRVKRDVALARGSGYTFSGKPVWALRHLLFRCPDEGVTAATHELRFVKPTELRDDLRIDLSEAYQSLNEGRWKAATVLAGSVIEALLVWRLSKLSVSVRQKAVSALTLTGGQKSPSGPVEEWSFWALIEVAAIGGLIKPDTAIQLRLTKKFRNLIHPGLVIRKQSKCGKDTALAALAGVECVARDLGKK
jgi:hypothetical protein